MRLNDRERLAIVDAARSVLPPRTRLSLFGSRVDDSRRGGDLDLLVEPEAALEPMSQVRLRTRLAARLYRSLGERRIDIVIAESVTAGEPPLVVREARRQAVELVTT